MLCRMKTCKIAFPGTNFPDLEVNCAVPLPQQFTSENSPVTFGCCQGICGTCLVNVIPQGEPPAPASALEQETLSMMAPNHPHARLTCQLQLHGDIQMSLIKWVVKT
jgi:ferredoxin